MSKSLKAGLLNREHFREHFIGVDLATGRSMAGNTWIARLSQGAEGQWQVAELSSLKTYLTQKGLSTNPTLKLFELLLQHPNALIGIDASFGIPQSLMTQSTWEAWVQDFARLYPDADAFRQACQEASPPNKELKRQTDIEAKTPFSPYNLRHYRQTFTVVHDVLRPFLMAQKGSILPMQAPVPQKPWLVESCPASVLKTVMSKVPVYKGKTADCEKARQAIVEHLQGEFPFQISVEFQETILSQSGGDALDSLLIAWHLCRLWQTTPDIFDQKALPYLREGFVF
jgi:hypothetical protein